MAGSMSTAVLVAAGCAAGAVWVLAADRDGAARRVAARARAPAAVPGALLRRWPAPTLAAGAATLTWGPVAGLLAAGAVVGVQRALAAARAAADRERLAAAVGSVCSVLATELRAGRPPEVALSLSAEDLPTPLAGTLQRAVLATRLAGDVPAALEAAAAAATGAGALLLRQLGTCWQVAGRTGAGLAGVVDALAGDLRARERLRLETNAALAGPRTTAWLLAALPVVGIAMAAGFGAAPGRVLLRTPAGLACLVVGIVLDVLGVLWSRRLVRRALEPR